MLKSYDDKHSQYVKYLNCNGISNLHAHKRFSSLPIHLSQRVPAFSLSVSESKLGKCGKLFIFNTSSNQFFIHP